MPLFGGVPRSASVVLVGISTSKIRTDLILLCSKANTSKITLSVPVVAASKRYQFFERQLLSDTLIRATNRNV